MSKNKADKLALGALIGGIAGYITGVLTAPKSGKQTRTDIVDKVDSVKDGAESQLQNAVDELTGTIDNLKSQGVALSSKARSEYDETMVRAKDVQNKARQVLKAVKAGEANDPELNKAVKQARQAAKNLAKYIKS